MNKIMAYSKHALVIFITSIFVFALLALLINSDAFSGESNQIQYQDMSFNGTYDWEKTPQSFTSSSDYLSYSDLHDIFINSVNASDISNALSGIQFIRFDTAEELYQFSVDVSFYNVYDSADPEMSNKVTYLLSLDYVLGRDIDYSVMKSRAFLPIGYDFTDMSSNSYSNVFTGTFDGQGFEIKNLFLGGSSDFVFEEELGEETVYTPIASFYAMFTYNEGTIKNIGLINPNLELLEVNENLTQLANLIGENSLGGIIDHVYVIDNRESVTQAGIRYRVGSSSLDFEAAGIVHTNNGNFSNSYYTSKVVVNGNYINKFSVEPIYMYNNGNTSYLVYDKNVYLSEVEVGSSVFIIDTPVNGVDETTSVMQSDQSTLSLGDWHFYPEDGYPLLKGLVYDETDGYYQISTARDLAFISELLHFNTILNGNPFSDSNFKLTTNIDMSVLSPGVYKTPDTTFNGHFIGTNSQAIDNSDHFYIYNLIINDYITYNSKLYTGLFSVLGNGSLIKDLNFIDSQITLGSSSDFYSYDTYIGGLAGEMIAGVIEDVYVDVDISLDNDDLGSTRLGGIVGEASGRIERTSYNGLIDLNNHSFDSNNPIVGHYFIGGIVGRTGNAKLTINEAVNNNQISSLGISSQMHLNTSTPELIVYTGGVIGYSYHTSVAKHEMINVTNRGDINLRNITLPDTSNGQQYTGGVFGQVGGQVPTLEDETGTIFANFYNEGNISYPYSDSNIDVYSGGIGTTNFDGEFELALLTNHGTFAYDTSGATSSTTNFNYASMIYDVGDFDLTISRSYSHGNMIYDSNLFSKTYSFVETNETNDLNIEYSANYGQISYMSTETITATSDINIFVFSRNSQVNYMNVHNYGPINVVDIDMQVYDLYIAGFSKTLADTYYIENSLNEGNIVFADIGGSGNIYVSGFTNINQSGDLHLPEQSEEQPNANYGIINSINYGNITTGYNTSTYGVDGTNNTFVGGLATLNKGSIQDSANLGNIQLINTSTLSSTTFELDDTLAGLVSSYTAGIVAGGVSAIVLDGNSRIYDSSNNGDVIAKAEEFVRTGGVLGVSLYQEALSGGITSTLGLVDNIQNSVLSNGFNFGNISAITSVIGSYQNQSLDGSRNYLFVGTPPSQSYMPFSGTSTTATDDRPPVYASAGGVIGYGLSYMQRMLNHGTISSTDVAGGVVGATYALGNITTVTNITTAVNYGDIKSIENANFASITQDKLNSTELLDFYMNDGNSFIYPSEMSRELPASKRAFGGIFGRLQRGLNGDMTSNGGSFDFIVNANPNIDLIGRLDQVNDFSSSLRFFIFNDAIYYSAKVDDTTQTVFSGFLYAEEYVSSVEYLGYTPSEQKNKYDHYYEITTAYVTYHQQGDGDSIYSTTYSTFEEVVLRNNRNEPGSSYNVGDPIQYEHYVSTAPIPWITEDPNDPLLTDSASEYMYDENFEMRSNPELSEYIYYAEASLLADRFQTTGTNPRPNGMYVLSTTAGENFGLVLPNNISIYDIELIDESKDISLNEDYHLLPNSDTLDLDEEVVDQYNLLRQTKYNEKSNLMDDPEKQRFTLEETNGSSNIIEQADIDYLNHVITISISMEAFLLSQTSADFDITNALTSANALIGIRASEYGGSLTDLQDALYLERYTDITSASSTKAILDVDLPSQNITSSETHTLGYFSVYSEAFVMDAEDGVYDFSNTNYYSDYRIDIEFLPNITQMGDYTGVDSVSFNGGSTTNISPTYTVDLRDNGDVNYNGSLRLNFIDNNGLFENGYDFKNYFVLKYYDGSVVDEQYYDIETIPFNNNYYSITFNFSSDIKAGDYYLEYSYYPVSYTYRIDFDKGPSPNKDLIDFTYYSENDSLPDNITTNFSSYIHLGEILTPENGSLFNITELASSETYLSSDYDVSYMNSGSLVISDFAEIIRAELMDSTYSSGYRSYHLEYDIQAEDGSVTTYYHTLTERELYIDTVQKNDNFVDIDDVFAIREANLTEFIIDLGFDKPLIEDGDFNYGDPNNVFTVNVTGTNPEGVAYLPEEITGITYQFDEFFEIDMSVDTLPGTYEFEILYSRDGGVGSVDIRTLSGAYLKVTKLEGQEAYFPDLVFSQIETETLYPEINIIDAEGDLVPDPIYNPKAYFDGFDYDGAKEDNYPYFSIEGRVSNVPLDSYQPYFFDTLPLGATISKRVWNGSDWEWTIEVGQDSSQEDKALLSANFTSDPITGQETEAVIRYRVTSENGNHMVYYDISVSDVIYNVTLIFDIYYCSSSSKNDCVLADQSVELSDELTIINVQNLLTDGRNDVYGVTDPTDYPEFTEVLDVNNQILQFYYPASDGYNYRFGRNKSNYYNFSVDLPLDQYLNDVYDYDIEFVIGGNEYILNDASDYVSGLQGKYFYIEQSIHMRTRYFNIYIYPITSPTTDMPYGLFDFFKSWGKKDE
ncbi:MAG: hypothetical protein ACLFPM_02325 [Candidatus Izemoplasmatales bacterium]